MSFIDRLLATISVILGLTFLIVSLVIPVSYSAGLFFVFALAFFIGFVWIISDAIKQKKRALEPTNAPSVTLAGK